DLSFLIDAANRAGERLEEGRQAAAAQTAAPARRPSGAETKRQADVQSQQAGGLRELVGIAQRRRVRTQAGASRPADAASKAEAPAAAAALREADTADIAMEG
ncbi:MAG TPA: hypothetical protein VGF36_05330, partial [Rhodopila sp.]